MTDLSIALVQLRSEKGDIEGNLGRHRAAIEAAAARGVRLVVFPEMSITGYIDPTRWPASVLSLDSPEIARFLALTCGTGVTAVAGLVEARPGQKPFITQIVAADGALVAVYRKRHVVDDEADWFSAGPAEPTVFSVGGVRVGVAVCADIDNPAVYRDCAAAGAQVIVHASAPGLYGEQATRNWQSGHAWWRNECMTKDAAHARENGVYVVAATAAGRTIDEDFPGGGFAFAPDGSCFAATADWSEGVLDVAIPAPLRSSGQANTRSCPGSGSNRSG
ncbi:MAG: carbon-nitrogen hydrolase family protein [Thermomicrobiales bacterium]|nr:carbon-nitrogen hydrolase family protein [Thermomicrobiales bacterium]